MSSQNTNGEDRVIALDDPDYLALHERAVGTNVNEHTLLATDYLNHFNEVVMLLEMVPDMPDMLEEVQAWKPKGYKDHFRDSSIADKDLAVDAYDFVPTDYKQPFEKTVDQLDRLVLTSIERLEYDLATGNMDLARENSKALSLTLQRLIDMAGGIIHGSQSVMDQSEIDILLGTPDQDGATQATTNPAAMDQSDIDSMFD